MSQALLDKYLECIDGLADSGDSIVEYKIRTDWQTSLDNMGWAVLDEGYALVGFYRGEKTWLARIEKAISAKGPWDKLEIGAPASWKTALATRYSWATCQDGFRLVTAWLRGFNYDTDNDWVSNLHGA